MLNRINTILLKLLFITALVGLCACSAPVVKTPALTATPTNAPARVDSLVFVGTYSANIYVYRMDGRSGALTLQSKASSLPNPSYLTVDPSKRYLVAVSETSQFNGQPGGGVSSYQIDAQNGSLTLINSQPSGGDAPCFVSIDPSGKWVLVANYNSGSVSVLPLGEDGRLGAPTGTVQHQGSSLDPERQAGPHAHSILVAPGSATLVLAADLGLDKVLLYDLDPVKGTLAVHQTAWLALKPGSGPRHMAFSPDQHTLYVVSELSSSVTAFRMDAAAGTFTEVQTASLLPDSFSGSNASADIHVTPDGKHLYASNRGANSLAIFSIDAQSGKLTPQGQASSGGETPRNFAIDPEGRFILAANQDSGTIVTLSVDAPTGALSLTGQTTSLPSPVCIKFFEP